MPRTRPASGRLGEVRLHGYAEQTQVTPQTGGRSQIAGPGGARRARRGALGRAEHAEGWGARRSLRCPMFSSAKAAAARAEQGARRRSLGHEDRRPDAAAARAEGAEPLGGDKAVVD